MRYLYSLCFARMLCSSDMHVDIIHVMHVCVSHRRVVLDNYIQIAGYVDISNWIYSKGYIFAAKYLGCKECNICMCSVGYSKKCRTGMQ